MSAFSERRFAFLMFPGFEELDMIGPWEMATMWRSYADGPSCFTLAEELVPMTCAKGLSVTPDYSFADAPAFDYLLVPGGFAALKELERAEMLDFLRIAAVNCRAVLSVCTGSLMLEAAGLLDGRRATTNWKFLERMRASERVTLVEERFVRDGPVWTSGGVAAGMDMLLGFIASEAGEEVAGVVQINAEYYPDSRVYGEAASHQHVAAYVRRLLASMEAAQ